MKEPKSCIQIQNIYNQLGGIKALEKKLQTNYVKELSTNSADIAPFGKIN